MKVFGKRALAPEQSVEQADYAEPEPEPDTRPAVVQTNLRERVLKQIDPSAAASR